MTAQIFVLRGLPWKAEWPGRQTCAATNPDQNNDALSGACTENPCCSVDKRREAGDPGTTSRRAHSSHFDDPCYRLVL